MHAGRGVLVGAPCYDSSVELMQLSTPQSIASACALVSRQIPDVVRSHIGHVDDMFSLICRGWLRDYVEPHVGAGEAVMVPQMWVGAYDDARRLIGAVHVSPLTNEASQHITGYLDGRPGMGDPPWILRLLNVTARVEELAVRPEHRGRGVGAALLVEVHRLLRLHHHPVFGSVESVSTFASSAACPVFASSGYTVGKPRTPVPSHLIGGLPTMWDATYDGRDGAFCYSYLDHLA